MQIVFLQKGYLFYQNSIQKGKGLKLRAQPPHMELCRVTCKNAHTIVGLTVELSSESSGWQNE